MEKIYERTIHVNGCYVGDPCYAAAASGGDFYEEWLDQGAEDGQYLGDKALIYGTGIGDGYFSADSWVERGENRTPYFHFPVDAGVLGVVNAPEASDNSLDLMEYFPDCIRVTMSVSDSKATARSRYRKFEFILEMSDGSVRHIEASIAQW